MNIMCMFDDSLPPQTIWRITGRARIMAYTPGRFDAKGSFRQPCNAPSPVPRSQSVCCTCASPAFIIKAVGVEGFTGREARLVLDELWEERMVELSHEKVHDAPAQHTQTLHTIRGSTLYSDPSMPILARKSAHESPPPPVGDDEGPLRGRRLSRGRRIGDDGTVVLGCGRVADRRRRQVVAPGPAVVGLHLPRDRQHAGVERRVSPAVARVRDESAASLPGSRT
jgi:hypothetical protein